MPEGCGDHEKKVNTRKKLRREVYKATDRFCKTTADSMIDALRRKTFSSLDATAKHLNLTKNRNPRFFDLAWWPCLESVTLANYDCYMIFSGTLLGPMQGCLKMHIQKPTA